MVRVEELKPEEQFAAGKLHSLRWCRARYKMMLTDISEEIEEYEILFPSLQQSRPDAKDLRRAISILEKLL